MIIRIPQQSNLSQISRIFLLLLFTYSFEHVIALSRLSRFFLTDDTYIVDVKIKVKHVLLVVVSSLLRLHSIVMNG